MTKKRGLDAAPNAVPSSFVCWRIILHAAAAIGFDDQDQPADRESTQATWLVIIYVSGNFSPKIYAPIQTSSNFLFISKYKNQ